MSLDRKDIWALCAAVMRRTNSVAWSLDATEELFAEIDRREQEANKGARPTEDYRIALQEEQSRRDDAERQLAEVTRERDDYMARFKRGFDLRTKICALFSGRGYHEATYNEIREVAGRTCATVAHGDKYALGEQQILELFEHLFAKLDKAERERDEARKQVVMLREALAPIDRYLQDKKPQIEWNGYDWVRYPEHQYGVAAAAALVATKGTP